VQRPGEQRPLERDVGDPGRLERGRDAQRDELAELARRAGRTRRLRDGALTEFPLPRSDARPFGIAVDGSGNVWFTDLSGGLGRLSAERARGR